VADTSGIWFNKYKVRSLTDPRHTAKLGGASGPGTE
jgi:hypothetical protein